MPENKKHLIRSDLDKLLGPSRTEDFQVYSGPDIRAVVYTPLLTKERAQGSTTGPKIKVFAELDTLSISSTRSISPVRVLGRPNPIGFTRGCISGSELVHTKRGLVPIHSVQRGDMILAQNEASGEPVYRRCTDHVSTGVKECYSVILADGTRMSLTKDHKVKTVKGWKRVDHLALTDSLFVPVLELDVDAPTILRDDSLVILACCFAAECKGETTIDLSLPGSKRLLTEQILTAFDTAQIPYSATSANSLLFRCAHPALRAFRSAFQDFEIVNRLGRDQLQRFMCLVWQFLGSSPSQSKRAFTLRIGDPHYAYLCKQWLGRLGVHGIHQADTVSVIGIDRQTLLHNVRPQDLDLEYAHYLDDTVELPGPRILQQQVKRIDLDGIYETFDIEVEEAHCLFGGFLSHNSRTFAGSLVFATINHDVFHDMYATDMADVTDNPTDLWADQMPPFSIVLTLANEVGGIGIRILNDIYISHYGTAYSIFDAYARESYTYVASSVTPFIPIDDKKLGEHSVNVYGSQAMPSVLDVVEQHLGYTYDRNYLFEPYVNRPPHILGNFL